MSNDAYALDLAGLMAPRVPHLAATFGISPIVGAARSDYIRFGRALQYARALDIFTPVTALARDRQLASRLGPLLQRRDHIALRALAGVSLRRATPADMVWENALDVVPWLPQYFKDLVGRGELTAEEAVALNVDVITAALKRAKKKGNL